MKDKGWLLEDSATKGVDAGSHWVLVRCVDTQEVSRQFRFELVCSDVFDYRRVDSCLYTIRANDEWIV